MSIAGRQIRLLELRSGKIPFERWFRSQKDKIARQRILAAITRLANPSYKGFESVGGGVQELRIFYGPGYRVYFGMKGDLFVVLLGGGDKSGQKKDIDDAKRLWKEFQDEIARYQQQFNS